MENRMSVPAHRMSLRAALVVLLTGALFAGSAVAQTGQPGGGPGKGGSGLSKEEKQELRQAQQKVQELRQKIVNIQKQAIENNPELKSQQEDLQGLLKEKMKSKGTAPDKDLSRMKDIRKQLSGNKEMPKEERKQLMQEFQQKAKGIQKAQKSAMQDPEVQKAREKFRDDLMTAMKKEDPKVEQLIQDLKQARKEFQKLLSNRFSGQGMGGGAPKQGN